MNSLSFNNQEKTDLMSILSWSKDNHPSKSLRKSANNLLGKILNVIIPYQDKT